MRIHPPSARLSRVRAKLVEAQVNIPATRGGCAAARAQDGAKYQFWPTLAYQDRATRQFTG